VAYFQQHPEEILIEGVTVAGQECYRMTVGDSFTGALHLRHAGRQRTLDFVSATDQRSTLEQRWKEVQGRLTASERRKDELQERIRTLEGKTQSLRERGEDVQKFPAVHGDEVLSSALTQFAGSLQNVMEELLGLSGELRQELGTIGKLEDELQVLRGDLDRLSTSPRSTSPR